MLMRSLYKLLNLKYETRRIMVGGNALEAYVADSFAKKMFGLMYRKDLGKDKGMLFTMGRESREGASIWMMNMNFSIDIIWLDRDFRVVDIKADAKPCKSMWGCETYSPREKVKYVLEVNSGDAKRLGIMTGEKLALKD